MAATLQQYQISDTVKALLSPREAYLISGSKRERGGLVEKGGELI